MGGRDRRRCPLTQRRPAVAGGERLAAPSQAKRAGPEMGQGWNGPGSLSPPRRRPMAGRGPRPGAPLSKLRSASTSSLPSPAAFLSFCTSAGNVPLTYIFFQTYVTFFFFSLCGRRQARIQEKKKQLRETGAREQTGRLSSELRGTPSRDRGAPYPATTSCCGPLRGSRCRPSTGNLAGPASLEERAQPGFSAAAA